VFYDSENYVIADSYVVNKNCNDALDHLNIATDVTSPFTTISDVTTINSFRCVRKSLREAVEVVLERWGGHIVRNNWSIGIRASIGQDNGVTVRYRKNLKEISCEENWEDVVTKLMPVGKDGILLNAVDPTASLYVYSDTSYDIPYTKVIHFDQDNISEDDYKDAQGNLNEEAYKTALVEDLRARSTRRLGASSTSRSCRATKTFSASGTVRLSATRTVKRSTSITRSSTARPVGTAPFTIARSSSTPTVSRV
ncbi:MAG: phage tail protein, partial [Thermoguttaceae bacterium]|nr:phage tail protein [Thermoguttaceae bacterium]